MRHVGIYVSGRQDKTGMPYLLATFANPFHCATPWKGNIFIGIWVLLKNFNLHLRPFAKVFDGIEMNITFTKSRRISGVVFEAVLMACIIGYLRTGTRLTPPKSDHLLSFSPISSKAIVMRKAADVGARVVSFTKGALSAGDVFAQPVEFFNTANTGHQAFFSNAFQCNIFYVFITANAP